MKKLIATILAMVVVLALTIPAMAVDVTTGVQVTSGGGSPPIVKCKWETPDDGDPAPPHGTPGTQIKPSGLFQVDKPIEFYAVVTDPEGVATVDRVYADVWHPAGPPQNGSFKYQLQMTIMSQADGIAAFNSGELEHLIKYAPPHDATTTLHQLEQGLARVWKGTQVLSYHQPWGDYKVQVKAYDRNNNPSIILENFFTYIAVTAFEIDFTKVDYGTVEVCVNKYVGGDTIFGGPPAEVATVRNIGNTNLKLTLKQTDMGFGQTSGVWNVVFDAKLSATGTELVYDPNVTVTIPDVLPLCNTQKLDFSIHVKKADPGVYSGMMTLGAIYAPF